MPLVSYVKDTDDSVHTQYRWLDLYNKEAHHATSNYIKYLNSWDRCNLISSENSLNYSVPSLYEKTTSLFLIQETLPNHFKANKRKLLEQFIAESKKYSHYILGVEASAKEVFNILSDSLSELKFEASNVELTDSKNIKFSLIFPGKKILMISKPITSKVLDSDKNEILFSFFINRKLIASDVAQLPPFIQGFKEYIAL